MPVVRLTACILCFLTLVTGQTQPDYSKNMDILNGRRTLLQVDDLGLLVEKPLDGTNARDISMFVYNSTYEEISPSPQGPWSVTALKDAVGSRAVFGRWWESQSDAAALLVLDGDYSWRLGLDLPGGVPFRTVPDSEFKMNCLVTADFTRDGYTDIAMATYFDGSAGPVQQSLILASASDTTKPSAPKFGPPTTPPTCLAMTQGDFNGDGQLEMAMASPTAEGGLLLTLYTVDPKAMSFTPVSTLTLTTPGVSPAAPITKVSLTAGKFTNDTRQQLAIAFSPDNSDALVKTIDVQDLRMREAGTFTPTTTPGRRGSLGLEASKLLASHSNDFLVFYLFWKRDNGQHGQWLLTLTVDPTTLNLTANKRFDFPSYDCSYGFAVGNFDATYNDQLILDRELAIVGGDCNAPSAVEVAVVRLNEDLTDFDITTSEIPVPMAGATALTVFHGDFQGRSMMLGAPTKIELNQNVQTSVVVAAPPSHVDFIAPANETKPKVLNISALPGFKTSYNTITKGQNQSSNTSGTSWGAGATESVNQTFSLGSISAGAGFQEKSSLSASQQLKSESDKEHTSYSGVEYDVSSSSGAGDNFWYSSSRLNIWVYPVIGKSVCPTSKPNCSDSEKVPMVLMYSGPDQIENVSTTQEASALYQPPWEYGNLLSYPVTTTNNSQLQAIVPEIDLLTSASEPSFSVSGGPLTINTNWTAGGSTGSKSSFTQNYSFDASLSVQGALGIPAVGSIGGGYSLDVTSSFGFSSQTTNQQSLDTSTGLSINKPGGFRDTSLYGYTARPFIFGRTKPANILDTSKAPTANVGSFGALRSAFTVDIVSSSAGGFWRQAYGAAPDIGLSHPARWAHSSEALQDPPPDNCRNSGANSQQDCFDVHPHFPNNPWLSPSLFMQGFFVTNARNGPIDPSQMVAGPNLTFATAGTKLTLQARVYNFSLAAMPVNSTVHVQFYGMPWNTTNNSPAGTPFKIGPTYPTTGSQDVVLGAIPPLSDGSLNWAFAEVDFDTTAYGDQHLVFWVLVWAETGSGSNRALVREIAGHGLSALPDDVITDMSKVPVEMNPSVKGPLVTYSNNLGFYRSAIYIAPNTSEFRTTAATADRTKLRLLPVEISQRVIAPNQPIEISTMIQPQGVPAPGAIVRFYDGHPDEGGTLIRAEHVTWIRESGTHQVKIPYMPRKPGLRRIWAFLNKGTPYESVRASEILCVGGSCLADIVPALSGRRAAGDRPLDPREKP